MDAVSAELEGGRTFSIATNAVVATQFCWRIATHALKEQCTMTVPFALSTYSSQEMMLPLCHVDTLFIRTAWRKCRNTSSMHVLYVPSRFVICPRCGRKLTWRLQLPPCLSLTKAEWFQSFATTVGAPQKCSIMLLLKSVSIAGLIIHARQETDKSSRIKSMASLGLVSIASHVLAMWYLADDLLSFSACRLGSFLSWLFLFVPLWCLHKFPSTNGRRQEVWSRCLSLAFSLSNEVVILVVHLRKRSIGIQL